MRKPKHGANRIARMADRIYDAERCRGIRIPAAVVAFLTAVSMLIPLTVSAESVGSFSVPGTSATWTGCAPEDECTIGDNGHSIAFDTQGSSSSITAQAQYSLQVSAQTGAGEGVSMPAGTLEWRIPEYLFKGRENENVGSSSLNIPACDSASDSTSWCYTVDQAKSEYVVTNHLPVTDARSVDVTVTYTASPEKIVDKDVSQDKPYKDNGISSVHSTVTTSDGTPKQSNDITAQVDTSVTLDSVTKANVGGIYDTWPSTCPNNCWYEEGTSDGKPADADQYVYALWKVTVKKSGNQPGTLTISDTITDQLDGEPRQTVFIGNPSAPGMLIPSGGHLGQPMPADTDKHSAEPGAYYIITEYPKTANLDGAALSDEVTATLMPSDTDEPQYKTGSATFTNTPPADFVPPESMYRLQKGVQESQSDDVNWSSRYKYRSQSDGDDVQIDGGLTALANGENVVSNDFVNHYYANTYSLTTDSGNVSSTQSDYGKTAVRHEFIDDMFAFGDAKANEMEQDGNDPSDGSDTPQRGFAQLQPGDYSISNIYIPRGNCFDKGCSEAGNEYKSGLTIYRYGYDWNSESWKMINDPAADDLIEIWAKAGDGRWYRICSEKASAVAAYGYQGSAYGGTAVKAVCTGKDIGAIELNLHVEITLNPTEHVKQLLHTVDQTTGKDTDKLRDAAYLTDFNTMKVYRGNVFLDSSGDPYPISDGSQYTSDMRGFCLPQGGDSSCAPASSELAIGQDDENDIQSYYGWHGMFNVLPFGPQKKETGTENQSGPPSPDWLLHATAQQKLTPFKPVSVIHKSAESPVNDVAHRQWKVSWSVKANECATPVSWWADGDCTSGKNHFFGMYVNKLNGKPQNRGTFWDLLPDGLHPDMDSIRVTGTSGESLKVASAQFLSNWKGSGRDMLKVTAEGSNNYDSDGSGMVLTFDSAIDYDDIWDMGHDGTLNLHNVVSYETGNSSIADGALNSTSAGMPSDFVAQEKAWMMDLNGSGGVSNQERFLYDAASADISVDSVSSSGLTKTVRGGQYSFWTNGKNNQVTVRADGEYQYRLRYGTDSDTRAKNVVLYDSLENYLSTDTSTTDIQVDGSTPRWRGTLQSVDLSKIPSDVQAKVYYSTKNNLKLSGATTGNHDLTNTSIWTECTPSTTDDCSTQYANAHAIAVDLSKKTDGNDYVLPPNSALSVILNMKAPSEAQTVKDYVNKDAHAYNGVHATFKNINTSDTNAHYLDIGYTKVGLVGDEAMFDFTKVDGSTTARRPLAGAQFRLFQWKGTGAAPTSGLIDTSIPGTDWTQRGDVLTSGSNGKVDFGGLPEGTYRLVEVGAPEGFSLPDVQWQLTAPKPTDKTAGTTITQNNLVTVTAGSGTQQAGADQSTESSDSYWSTTSDSTSGLTLTNYRLPLPATGGPGTWCRMAGCVVFAAAATVMTGALLRRRRRSIR